jgi:hypothetical protein
MTDPIDEVKAHRTRLRQIDRWLYRYVDRLKNKAAEKAKASRAQLSPAAARLLVAMESEPPPIAENPGPELPSPRGEPGEIIDAEFPEVGEDDPAPADCEPPAMQAGEPDEQPLPGWTQELPPELPPGAMTEAPERRKRERVARRA